MIATTAVMLLGLISLACKRRRFFKQYPSTLLGSVLLVSYVLLRVASIDHPDESAGLKLGDRPWLAAMELSGVLCLALAAERAARDN